MIKRITKKVKEEAKVLLETKGYWSKEMQQFLSTFEYSTRIKINSMIQTQDKYGYGL